MSTGELALSLRDGGELAHAWLQDFCARRSIRVLFIKGPSLSHHGLRQNRVSSDVDALVDPADFERVCAELTAAGWRERPGTYGTDRYSLHSRAFVADGWPCDVDVHRFYPGFLEPPAAVFEELWKRRESLDLAHVACAIPDRAGSILILALHSLRSNEVHARHAMELREMRRSLTLSEDEQRDLGVLAVATGADRTMGSVLADLGVTVETMPQRDLTIREWEARVSAGSTPTYMWISLLRHSRGRERLRTLRHAVWPVRADLQVMYPHLEDSARARLVARVTRLGRGMRALPHTARAVVAALRRTD